MTSFIEKINQNFCQQSEELIMAEVETLCGLENYRPNLEYIKKFLGSKIFEIESSSKLIVVGGTNGKGETSHCLRQLLYENGHDVMMWTSPHVLTVRERFIFNKSPIEYEELKRLMVKVSKDLDNERLSFYEFLLCCFLYWTLEKKPKFIVLEVGLGGRFDGVNLFTNPLNIVTSISRDHTKILGNTLKEILTEKYGITRIGGELISGIEQEYLHDLLEAWCARDSIKLERVFGQNFRESNQKMANLAFSKLTGKSNQRRFEWETTKGRFEQMVQGGVEFTFVGSHNIDGHRKLLELLNKKGQNSCDVGYSSDQLCVLSFSTGREDQVDDILTLYRKHPCVFSKVILTSFEDKKAMDKEFIKSMSGRDGDFEFLTDWNNLFNVSYKKIFITGSYYFISAFQRYLLSLPKN